MFHDCPVTPLTRYPVSVSHYPALLSCLPRPFLLDQLLRPHPDSFVLIFEGQDQRIDRSRGRGLRPGFEGLEPDANLRRVESLGHPLWHDQAVH